MTTTYDIVIIGGGPIGLYAAGLAGEMGASCAIIESMPHPGGILMAAYPDKEIYNFPGIPGIKGRNLIQLLQNKTAFYQTSIKLGEYVREISKNGGILTVKSNKHEYSTSAVLIATGLKAYYSGLMDCVRIHDWDGTRIYDNWPPIDNLYQHSVAFVLGSSAKPQLPDDILIAVKSMICIGDRNNLDEEMPAFINSTEAPIEIVQRPWYLGEIAGTITPQSIVLINEENGEERRVGVDSIIGFYDVRARQTLFTQWGIEMSGQHIKVDGRMRTNLKNIYAAGDIAWYPGKIRLLSTGTQEARIAVKNALKKL